MSNHVEEIKEIDKLVAEGKIDKPNSGAVIRSSEELSYLADKDLSDPKYNNARKLIDILFEDIPNMDFERFIRLTERVEKDENGKPIPTPEDKVERNRPIPGHTPEINAVITDWDGTVGDYYEHLAKAVDNLVDYISRTRGIKRSFLEDYLKKQGGSKGGKYFTSFDYFSPAGVKRILSSYPFLYENPETEQPYDRDFTLEDEKYMTETFTHLMDKMYAHTYTDAEKMFQDIRARGVPIFVHTDGPLSEHIQKLIATKLVTFNFDENGRITGVRDSVFAGFAVQADIGKPSLPQQMIDDALAVLEAANIPVIINSREEAKPNPEPLHKIQKAFKELGFGKIKAKNILVIGDVLAKDGGFAYHTGSYFVWPGEKAIFTNLAVNMERITAAGNPAHKKRILAQTRVFANNTLKGSEKKMRSFAKQIAVCVDYNKVTEMFQFKAPEKERAKHLASENFISLQKEKDKVRNALANRKLPFNNMMIIRHAWDRQRH